MRTRLVHKIYPFAYARSSSGNVYLTAGVPPVTTDNDINVISVGLTLRPNESVGER